jgi:hypothetical protein
MHYIEHMHLRAFPPDEQTARELAAVLPNHLCLKHIIPFALYPILLPALHSIQSLTKVTLNKDASDRAVSPDAAHAMAGLLRMGHSHPQLQLELEDWQFDSPETNIILCKAIAETTIRGLVFGAGFAGCRVLDPRMLATSLSQSKLKEIDITRLKVVDGDVTAFLAPLSQSICSMTELEEFKCDPSSLLHIHGGDESEMHAKQLATDKALFEVVQAVAHCPKLKRLQVIFYRFHPQLDRMLGACLTQGKNELAEIRICCHQRFDAETTQVTESPLLLAALKSNYTIREIHLNINSS